MLPEEGLRLGAKLPIVCAHSETRQHHAGLAAHLIFEVGVDGFALVLLDEFHEGAKLLADQGYPPEMIAEAALQEDVDVVGLSILSGAHNALAPRILELLRSNGQTQVKVFIGGIVPDEDVPQLKAMGISGVYGPGASTEDIIKEVREAVK